jgi:type IV secretion system protein VirB5
MRLILAILLPWLQFFTIGKPISGICCLLLQITLIGWIPASIWSVYALSQYKTSKRIDKALSKGGVALKSGVVAVLFVFSASSAVASGIPVIDAANIAQSVVNHLKQIAEMAKQLTELQRHYDQMVKQYTSMTSGRGLGSATNSATHKNYLPDEWQGVYTAISGGGYSGLTSSGKTVRSNNQKYDICGTISNSDQKKACERQTALAYQHRSDSTDAFDKAKARLTQIESLMKLAGESEDQKAILELNARIQAEQAMIQNESIKLQMYERIMASERRLAEQQEKETAAKALTQRGGFTLGVVEIK